MEHYENFDVKEVVMYSNRCGSDSSASALLMELHKCDFNTAVL